MARVRDRNERETWPEEVERTPRRHRRRRAHPLLRLLPLLLAFCLGLGVGWLLPRGQEGGAVLSLDGLFGGPTEPPEMPDWVTVDLIPVNEYSRPGIALERVNGIVVHYVGNPGTTAENNRNYFAGLAETGEAHASSHFVIGLEGEIIQCVPLDEVAYCSNDRNYDTISIECCHPDETGEFTEATYGALVRLTAFLSDYYGLGREEVLRHYDVTGKLCPIYFVEHEDAWQQFLDDVF